MEKRLLIFLVLAVAIFWIWAKINPQKPPVPQPVPPVGTGENGSPSDAPAEPGGTETPVEPPSDEPAASEEPAFRRRGPDERQRTTLDSPQVLWEFDAGGGGVARARLKEYSVEPGQDLTKPDSWYPVLADRTSDAGRPLEGGARDAGRPVRDRSLTIQVIDANGKVALELDEAVWTRLESGRADRVVYALDLPSEGVRFTKTFTVPGGSEGREAGIYHLDFGLGMKVTDLGKARRLGAKGWRIRLFGPASLPREPFDLEVRVRGGVLTSDIVTREEISPPGKVDPGEIEVWPEPSAQGPNRLVEWTGIHSRFFASILKSRDPGELKAGFARFVPREDYDPKMGAPFANLKTSMDFVLPLPAEGGTVTREFLFFAGPMDPDVFDEEEYATFASIIDYGILAVIAKLLVLLLGVIQSVVSNWGVAIILLTLVVRIGMFPLSRKSQVSMQKYQRQMGSLKPKIDVLKEQHKNNKKKLQEAQMKLMRDEGVSMVPKGCLVIFLQMPIFIGLFQALRYTIGLRHASFLWASDLTAPECILGPYYHSIPLVWNPFYLNIFPILMGITWYLSAAMAPKATDPQQAQQQKMMKWMPVLFSLFLYNYASGLALYMVVSSTWSIFEMKVVRKILDKPDQTPVTPAASPTFRKGR